MVYEWGRSRVSECPLGVWPPYQGHPNEGSFHLFATNSTMVTSLMLIYLQTTNFLASPRLAHPCPAWCCIFLYSFPMPRVSLIYRSLWSNLSLSCSCCSLLGAFAVVTCAATGRAKVCPEWGVPSYAWQCTDKEPQGPAHS